MNAMKETICGHWPACGRQWTLLVAALLVVGHALHAQQELPASLQKTFADGVAALKAGNLETAERAFLAVLKRSGRTGAAAFAHHNLGVVYQQRGDHERAVAEFHAAIRLLPNHGESRLLVGSSLLVLNRVAEAARELERAAALLPKEQRVRRLLAQAYERAEDWLGAVGQYQQLCEMEPREAEYAYRLGRAYTRLAEWSRQRLLSLNPRSARIQQMLGHSYHAQGQNELALEAFRRAAAADPKLPEVHFMQAMILLELKRYDEALAEIELELKIRPENRGALLLKQRIEQAKSAP